MNAPAVIRKATPRDARGIATVQVRTWQAAYRGILPQEVLDKQSVDGRTQRWTEILSGDASNTLVAVCEEVVGFISVGPARDEDTNRDTTGEVWAIYVLPTVWGQQIGRALWQAGKEHVRLQGFQDLILWVLEANDRARGFYEAVGCILDGTTSKNSTVGGVPQPQVRYRMVLD